MPQRTQSSNPSPLGRSTDGATEKPLVSVIMPAYNAEKYITEAIDSILAQTYGNWELLVVNDGSTDGTAAILEHYKDPRIRVFHKANGGIGSARNLALLHVRGSFICGLDSDDVMPPGSIAARVAVFDQYPEADIADGQVIFTDATLKKVLRVFTPAFTGEPFRELVRLSGTCFMGFSWLIRWSDKETVRFNEDISHGEDLVFYLHYAPGKQYRHTTEPVLIYRRTGHSSMSDLEGVERSYRRMENFLRAQGEASREELAWFHWRRKRIMVGSYWKARKPFKALRAFFL
jgi:teichuronic acid biosynthesis glycosyltransferase TuaG